MMGYYINPREGTKEAWLAEHGVRVSRDIVLRHDFTSSKLPVCLVDNVRFTAAGIGYDPGEVMAFVQGMEGRRHQWFLVEKVDLEPWYREVEVVVEDGEEDEDDPFTRSNPFGEDD